MVAPVVEAMQMLLLARVALQRVLGQHQGPWWWAGVMRGAAGQPQAVLHLQLWLAQD